jgi:tyrosyl-tRNA synthetase
MSEVARLSSLGGSEINEAKKTLATEATALLHGRAAAESAAETARQTFEDGALGAGLPTIDIPYADLSAGAPVLKVFAAAGLIASNGEGRRHIAAGALRINDAPLAAERALTPADAADGAIKLSIGKKKHAIARIV